MPISTDLLVRIEEVLNRLAAESVLAQPGRDDGLVLAYSLLGELEELYSGAPPLLERVRDMRTHLERRLETAQPFDEPSLDRLRELVEELGSAPSASAPKGRPPCW